MDIFCVLYLLAFFMTRQRVALGVQVKCSNPAERNVDVSHKGLDARKPSSMGCEQQRRRPASASAQSDQRLCYSLIGKYHI